MALKWMTQWGRPREEWWDGRHGVVGKVYQSRTTRNRSKSTRQGTQGTARKGNLGLDALLCTCGAQPSVSVVLLATSSKMRLYVPSALVSSSSEFSAAPMIDVHLNRERRRKRRR